MRCIMLGEGCIVCTAQSVSNSMVLLVGTRRASKPSLSILSITYTSHADLYVCYIQKRIGGV
jgi:hypothetical protein